ncbi:MAG: DNA-3-methyladenine glycosylase [Ruminococcaceae bacterium]|nr:DNA-3-methyladenine glycosylase [Oscillospiraceae bacterium]
MKLAKEFFNRDCLTVARELVGKILVHKAGDKEYKLRVTETEAYIGETDSACHAYKGRTPRTETMYKKGGTVYIYLCYGIHHLLNIVTGEENDAQAVLIRACEKPYDGPGKLTKALKITKELNNTNVISENSEIYFETDEENFEVITGKRIGIDYAKEEDREKPWRFILQKRN